MNRKQVSSQLAVISFTRPTELQDGNLSYEHWLSEVKARAADFQTNGPRAPVTWILTQGFEIPDNAIQGGVESSGPIYICRAFHEVSIISFGTIE
jgi:hypothetical protein